MNFHETFSHVVSIPFGQFRPDSMPSVRETKVRDFITKFTGREPGPGKTA